MDNDFLQFWKTYPNKVGKLAALKVWEKMSPPIAEVLAALEWQTTQESWTKDGGDWVPHPTTYLNAGRWMDEPKTKTFNGKPWHESASGIEAKAKEMGIAQNVDEPPFIFFARVKRECGL